MYEASRIDVGKMQVHSEFGGNVKLRRCIKIRRHKLHAELSRAAKSEQKHAITPPSKGFQGLRGKRSDVRCKMMGERKTSSTLLKDTKGGRYTC